MEALVVSGRNYRVRGAHAGPAHPEGRNERPRCQAWPPPPGVSSAGPACSSSTSSLGAASVRPRNLLEPTYATTPAAARPSSPHRVCLRLGLLRTRSRTVITPPSFYRYYLFPFNFGVAYNLTIHCDTMSNNTSPTKCIKLKE